MANQSKKSTSPKPKSDVKAKAISNHKGAAKPKVATKAKAGMKAGAMPQASKSKAAKRSINAQYNPDEANGNPPCKNSFADNSSSNYYASSYDAYGANLSDHHSGFMPFSSALNGHGFSDVDTRTNSVGGTAQDTYVSTRSDFSIQDQNNVNNADRYGNASLYADPNGISNSYNGSLDHSFHYSHNESSVHGQLDRPKDKKAPGSNALDSKNTKHKKQENFGINEDSDDDYVDADKTPKTCKDGTARKPRQPRDKLLKWNDNEWKQLVLGIVWACGEAGINIPFGQAAQLVHGKCTAGALQQAILKLRVKQNAAGEQVPPLRMAWTRNKAGNWINGSDQLSTAPKGQTRPMIARRKPTRHQENQTLMFTFKRAYIEEDRVHLPFPYCYGPDVNDDVDMEDVDEQDDWDSVYTLFTNEEDVLEHSSAKQVIPDQNSFRLTNTINTQLQEHGTTGLVNTMGGQLQGHSLAVLTTPVGRQIQEQNLIDLTDSLSTRSQDQDHAGLDSSIGDQSHEGSQSGVSYAYTSSQSGLTSGLFSTDEQFQAQMVDMHKPNYNVLPTGSVTGMSSFDFSFNDNTNVPVMSIEHQPGDSSSPVFSTPTGEDWSQYIFDMEFDGPRGLGYDGQSTQMLGAPVDLDFGGQFNQPLGDGSSPDSNNVFSPIYNEYFGQGLGQSSQTPSSQSSQTFVGDPNHGFADFSQRGSSNNSYHSLGDYAAQSAYAPAGETYLMSFQKDSKIAYTAHDSRSQSNVINKKKMAIPKGSKAVARFK